jgi:hypothetical protein
MIATNIRKATMRNLKITLLSSLMLCANSFAAGVFTPNSQPTGWLALPALTNTNLLSGSENVYWINYNRNDWSGDIVARLIGSNAVELSTGPWDPDAAATKLDLLDFDSGRLIITRDSSGSNIPFRLGSLSTTQQESLSPVVADQQKILDYVRGSRADEIPNGSYRYRSHVLGDILHSTLSYRYYDASTKRLYVGANDGMLHAFNALTGAEIFAYIPSMVIPNLKLLASNPYSHTYFVDGGLSIANFNFNGGIQVVLVGGLGAGGKGLYALDVTDPNATEETATAAKIKWEITSETTGYSNLGYTYGTPRLDRLNDNTPVAIVGNGYMNSGTGTAVLYLINADTGALVAALDTGLGSSSSPNGLSTPTLFDSNSDGKVDYAYAGDLDGHLIKFDLSSNTPSNYSATLLYTTSPAQPITTAPAVIAHPSGGRMVAFATGQLLTTGDKEDSTTVHYAYGIWDGQPTTNDTLLAQTLSSNLYKSDTVRTITANSPDWTPGSGHHKGWKVALPAGERVAGEIPFEKNGRFYFLTANPAVANNSPLPKGSNFMYELDMSTGGSVNTVIFDLNLDGKFDSLDLVTTGCTPASTITCIPIAKSIGTGVDSQPRYVEATGFNTTLFTNHPDSISNTVASTYDPGVSGGHFDFDISYFSPVSTINTSGSKVTGEFTTKNNICANEADVTAELGRVLTAPTYCTVKNGFKLTQTYMSKYVKSSTGNTSNCTKSYFSITCNKPISNTSIVPTYTKLTIPDPNTHEHQYDDLLDVTGVNMLNASEVKFNLSPKIIKSSIDTTQPFKVLLMNQYLNPAAKISVGGAPYESVKTYKNLASEANATTLLPSLPVYTRNTISTLIVNLPLDAFTSKKWWGDTGIDRVGLIPTQPECVYNLNANGTMTDQKHLGLGLIGPNGERFDGALTIQLIKANTPATALELNYTNTGVFKNGDDTVGTNTLTDSERARYGWRVNHLKDTTTLPLTGKTNFENFVLGEYTMYWHHKNGLCYGEAGWIADAPEDTSASTCPTCDTWDGYSASMITFFNSIGIKNPCSVLASRPLVCANDAKARRVTGSADPQDGIFAGGLAVKSDITTTTIEGTTRVITYVDGTITSIVTVISGGTTTTTTTIRGGTPTTVTTGAVNTAGSSSLIKGPEEYNKNLDGQLGRQSWWEIFQ